MDSRYHLLAERLTDYSTRLKPNEKVLIEAYDIPESMIIALIRAIRGKKAYPFVNIFQTKINRELLMGIEDAVIGIQADCDLHKTTQMDAYIGLRGSYNIFEQSDVPQENMKRMVSGMKKVQDHRVQKTKWVVLRWPSSSMAQQARMSTEAFDQLFFDVCTMDYTTMIPGAKALKKWMEKTDRVEIKGEGVDLRFSIRDIPAVACIGERNIPDGEVFTAPVKNSVEGTIHYNTPSIYYGIPFDWIILHFEKGKIIKSDASNPKALESILDSDEGARYIGEFAIGFNPYIREPIRDILFDEKITGSFHLTPGQAYEMADNGNRSKIHWDLISIQRPEYGGGEICFDGTLIRKDGLFVVDDLKQLNPAYLMTDTSEPIAN